MVLEQIKLIENDSPIHSCIFTGHRDLDKDFSLRALQKTVKQLVRSGCTVFYCGMAMGFDLFSGEAVLKAKKKNKDVKLVACLPCENQEKYYSLEDKKRYFEILKKADEKILLATAYYKGCMLARDRYMADRADIMVTYLKKESGGTAYTVRYFQKKYPQKKVIFL